MMRTLRPLRPLLGSGFVDQRILQHGKQPLAVRRNGEPFIAAIVLPTAVGAAQRNRDAATAGVAQRDVVHRSSRHAGPGCPASRTP